jgi:hypothetical protein
MSLLADDRRHPVDCSGDNCSECSDPLIPLGKFWPKSTELENNLTTLGMPPVLMHAPLDMCTWGYNLLTLLDNPLHLVPYWHLGAAKKFDTYLPVTCQLEDAAIQPITPL